MHTCHVFNMAGFCVSCILKVVMEEISFKGEKYVKASIIAEKLGYTADYVGQLCRSKQVDATLVGRSWYVSERSISEHKKNRYRSTLSKSKESIRKIAEERTTSRSLGFGVKKTSYGQDDSDLIPVIVKEKKLDEEAKQDKSTRDIEPIKLDNKPYNTDSAESSSERYSSRVSNRIFRNTTRALPPVRVISTRLVDMNTIPAKHSTKSEVKEASSSRAAHKRQHHSKEANLLGDVLTWILLLSVSIGVFLLLVGLEKRVVIIESGEEVILYNLSFDPLKTFIESQF